MTDSTARPSGSWGAMLRDDELRRRRALARLTKPELISRVIELEHAAADPTPLIRR